MAKNNHGKGVSLAKGPVLIVGLALLAFGLGGREVAGQMLGDAYDKGREQRGQVRRDMEVGKERGKQDARSARDKAGETTNGAPDGRPNNPPAAYRP